jgi:hypothetical protein
MTKVALSAAAMRMEAIRGDCETLASSVASASKAETSSAALGIHGEF